MDMIAVKSPLGNMEILTVVVPDLVRLAKKHLMENSMFLHLEHVRKGSLHANIGPHPVKTMADGIEYCALAVQIPHYKQKKCPIVFNDCEKVAISSDVLSAIDEKDTVVTFGKTKNESIYFFMFDRNTEKALHADAITRIAECLIRLTTNLKLRQLIEIEAVRLPVELTGSFIMSIKCEEAGNRTIEIYDENLTQVGFINGFIWKDIVV
ncbi:unnamed protein product [Caenorhabditis bovis]|uniref:Uncharacterized protein n=1 Tax=Caenorhabditis bovis TaxID=2654633 RepID=A0A8S1ELG0_9PELO|nr:unnamed protein product [Caenorhabditis bovis]